MNLSATSLNNLTALWNTEKALLVGDTALSTQENTSVQAQNALEEAYTHYYHLFLKHQNNAFTSSDCLDLVSLAQSCPSVVGAVVYQASVLYNLIYNTTEVFENECSTSKHRPIQQEERIDTIIVQGQAVFSLHPSSNDGTFTIQGTISEGDQLMIHSMNGEILYQSEQIEKTENLLIESNLSSGLYFVSIYSRSRHEIFKSKIVIIE